MKDTINKAIREHPAMSLLAINTMLLGAFSVSVVLYREAKEEGVSKMLRVLSVIGM
jgi:hypothetical protein